MAETLVFACVVTLPVEIIIYRECWQVCAHPRKAYCFKRNYAA